MTTSVNPLGREDQLLLCFGYSVEATRRSVLPAWIRRMASKETQHAASFIDQGMSRPESRVNTNQRAYGHTSVYSQAIPSD